MTLHTLIKNQHDPVIVYNETHQLSHIHHRICLVLQVPYSFSCIYILYTYDNDQLRRLLMVELACLKCAVYTTEYALYILLQFLIRSPAHTGQ